MGMSFLVFPSQIMCVVPSPHNRIWCWYHIQLVTSKLSPRHLPSASVCAEAGNRKLFQKEVGINLNTRIFGPFDYLQTDSCK